MKSQRYRCKLVGILFLILFMLVCLLSARSLLTYGELWTDDAATSPAPSPAEETVPPIVSEEPAASLSVTTIFFDVAPTPAGSPVFTPDSDVSNDSDGISSYFENHPEWVLTGPDPTQKGNDIQ